MLKNQYTDLSEQYDTVIKENTKLFEQINEFENMKENFEL
jgi:chromosome segregation ATPase